MRGWPAIVALRRLAADSGCIVKIIRRSKLLVFVLMAFLGCPCAGAHPHALRPTVSYQALPDLKPRSTQSANSSPTIATPSANGIAAGMRVNARRARRPRTREDRPSVRTSSVTNASGTNRSHAPRRSQFAAARRLETRAIAERDARAMRIYASSQLSAPNIPGATSCKRVGVHGESIYENCGMDTASH